MKEFNDILTIIPALNLAGLGAIGYYLFYIWKGLQQKVKNLSELSNEQKLTAQAIRDRADEYKKKIEESKQLQQIHTEEKNEILNLLKYEKEKYQLLKDSELKLKEECSALKAKLEVRDHEEIIIDQVRKFDFTRDKDLKLYVGILVYPFFEALNYKWTISVDQDKISSSKRKIIISIEDPEFKVGSLLKKQKDESKYIRAQFDIPENLYKTHVTELGKCFSELKFSCPIGIHFNDVEILEFNNSF